MDIIWLKRDVRLQDHGPFAYVADSKNKFVILYLHEPDQLSESTVHGSHLHFVHEGLVDLDRRLSLGVQTTEDADSFQWITICHNAAIGTFEYIRRKYGVNKILAHLETGHWQSFMRDKAVRKWCRSNSISIVEFNQTGVTRCLKKRDDYSKNFKGFMSKSQHKTVDVTEMRRRLVVLRDIPNYMPQIKLDLNVFTEIPREHRVDRPGRHQTGGSTEALATLESFLQERGSTFSQGISSPNTAWTSCSRLSPYLTWGHISLRYVIQTLQSKQEKLRESKKRGENIGSWLKSLQAFSSRLHWRSHFIQKLESEPIMEKQDMCPAYQGLRRQEGDWNDAFYQAWATGNTGFPFVDACMRCLIQHGWLNFRMRAMLVSFATYNLWLDWKRLAPHLARVFLDYEPGIHYPQLQMQSGTTGINAMRVYSVTKQGKDQDPQGVFIRRHVPALRGVSTAYIHEPWKMPLSVQQEVNTMIGLDYPNPIVDEQQSAKIAKQKVAAVRNLSETKIEANKVFEKHGSRNRRREEMNGRKPKALSSTVEREDPSKQSKITSLFPNRNVQSAPKSNATPMNVAMGDKQLVEERNSIKRQFISSMASHGAKRTKTASSFGKNWACKACTFLNDNPSGLACIICSTPRSH